MEDFQFSSSLINLCWKSNACVKNGPSHTKVIPKYHITKFFFHSYDISLIQSLIIDLNQHFFNILQINVSCTVIMNKLAYRNMLVGIMCNTVWLQKKRKNLWQDIIKNRADKEGNGQLLNNIKLLGHCEQERKENIIAIFPNKYNQGEINVVKLDQYFSWIGSII